MPLGNPGDRSYSPDIHSHGNQDMANKAKLHEILAVEKARTGQVKTLLEDTSRKFNKAADYYSGHLKSLKLIKDDPANAAIEAAVREHRQLPTTVVETL